MPDEARLVGPLFGEDDRASTASAVGHFRGQGREPKFAVRGEGESERFKPAFRGEADRSTEIAVRTDRVERGVRVALDFFREPEAPFRSDRDLRGFDMTEPVSRKGAARAHMA